MIAYVLLITAFGWSVSSGAVCSRSKYLLVFGASLSDNGVDASTTDAHGFQRWTNGPVWAEYLADDLLIKKNRQQNFAYGGARSGNENVFGYDWSGVLWQVDQYLNTTPAAPGVLNQTLVAFQASADADMASDLFDAKAIAANAASALRKLVKAGLKCFLVMNIGNPALIPKVKKLGKQMEQHTCNVAADINMLINGTIGDLQADYLDADIVLFNVDPFWKVLAKSGRFNDKVLPDNFANATEEAVAGDQLKYAWFDDVNPTTGVHKAMADEAFKLLKANKFI